MFCHYFLQIADNAYQIISSSLSAVSECVCVCVGARVHVHTYFYIDVWETSIQMVVALHLISKQARQKGLQINYLVSKNVMQVGC